jgi:hypothetical protein
MFALFLPLLATEIADDMARELQIQQKNLAREQGYLPSDFSNAVAGRRAWDVNRILGNVPIAEAFHRALGRALAKHHASADMASTEELLDRIAALIHQVRPRMARAEVRAVARQKEIA